MAFNCFLNHRLASDFLSLALFEMS